MLETVSGKIFNISNNSKSQMYSISINKDNYFSETAQDALKKQTSENQKNIQYKAQKTFEWISKKLGVQEGFLYIVMEKAGAKIEDFINTSFSTERLDTVADYLGLSDEEKHCLINDCKKFIQSLE